MQLFRFALALLCFVSQLALPSSAEAPAIPLLRQGPISKINNLNDQLSHGIKWSHGGYVVMDKVGSLPPTFYSLNREGAWTDTAHFQNPEPVGFAVFNYDRQSDGTIVFSGQTESGWRTVSPFLAWTSADGRTQKLIRTGNYFPYSIAVAPDDTLWTLGFEMVNLEVKNPAVNQEAHILRHLDRAGNVIASWYPQRELKWCDFARLSHSLLSASQQQISWYGQGPNGSVYFELLLQTQELKQYRGVPQKGRYPDLPSELATTADGIVSLQIEDRSQGGCRTIYVLDRDADAWKPVTVPPMGGRKHTPLLIGSDGGNLVFESGGEAAFFSVPPAETPTN